MKGNACRKKGSRTALLISLARVRVEVFPAEAELTDLFYDPAPIRPIVLPEIAW